MIPAQSAGRGGCVRRLLLLAAPVFAATSAEASDTIRFDRQIRPILSANCFSCHGPDDGDRQAELRLDRAADVFGDRGGYRLVVPGDPDESELIRRVTSDDPAERMPPAETERQLTSDQIALLGRWIEQGALWREHWAFVAPSRPPLPKVEQATWARSAIDRFVLARLESEGLSPSPEADRRTLIRRATFDLIGLPPRLEDVQAFLADQSPNAYEKVVDRLLASENYGEHMARFWLDAARYGDTHGLHLDNYREIWPFRDWVIRAFNANMPYDEFLTDQLAGDLIPGATLEQLIATGFIRCHVSTNEGGSIAEEVYVRNVVDRVDTFGTAALGLTLGCAACHDHKFDPLTQKDYYEFFAFFNSLDASPMDGNVKDPAPTVHVPTAEQAVPLAAMYDEIAELSVQREARLRTSEPSFARWLDEITSDGTSEQGSDYFNIADGLVVHFGLDEGAGEQVLDAVDPAKPGHVIGRPHWVRGQVGGGLEFVDGSYATLGHRGDFDEDESFSFGAWVNVPHGGGGPVVARTETAEGLKGYELFVIDDGRVSVLISGRWPGYAIKVTSRHRTLTPDTWHHLFVTYDGSKLAARTILYVDGKPVEVDVNSDSLKSEGSIGVKKPLTLGRRDRGASFVGGRIDDVRLYDRQLTDADVEAIYLAGRLVPLMASPRQSWTDEQLEMLRKFHVIRNDPLYIDLAEQIGKLQKRLVDLQSQIATTLVFREKKKPRKAFVLIRGQYDQRGEQVGRDVPPFLPPLPADLSRDRLGLAKWLVAPEHPLTSRVAVNRFWQQLFGAGLVETAEDFGSQGTPPSHPELLDWLAVEFRESGWDVKRLMKRIMMSATYRQRSSATPELLERDPQNQLLARGPRFRLDAEMLRDQALALSGLLVNRVGGPSVKPPQPADLWFAVGYSGSNTVRFVPDEGADKVYRRSLYTFWKRTAPPPQMNTFDAPSRESCAVRRERTNTPLQALLLMNEPQMMEAARYLAEQVLAEAPTSPRERAASAFERVTMRQPDLAELELLCAAEKDIRTNFEADAAAARTLVAGEESPDDQPRRSVEMATWTMMANLLLNLDEVITKE